MYFSSYLFKGFSLSLQFRILTQNHRSSRTIVLGLEHIICEIDAVMYITSLDLITFTIQLHNFGDVLIVSESMLRPVKISSLNSSCIFARPFAGCCCILLSVGFVNLRNFRHRGRRQLHHPTCSRLCRFGRGWPRLFGFRPH